MLPLDFLSYDFASIWRGLGLIGRSLYILGFTLLSLGKLTSDMPIYFVTILMAASLVMISLAVDFNLASALIQGFYIAMSLSAIFRRVRRSQPPQPRNI